MSKFVALVKSQINWMESQISRFPPGHVRYRPDQIAMYQRLIRDHLELLTFLESIQDSPSPSPQVDATSNAARPPHVDLSDLPPELLKELSDGMVRSSSDPLVDVIESRGGTASLDEILIDMYRKHGEVNKRNLLANRLYRLSKKGLVFILPGKKGIYTAAQPGKIGVNANHAEGSLFDRAVSPS